MKSFICNNYEGRTALRNMRRREKFYFFFIFFLRTKNWEVNLFVGLSFFSITLHVDYVEADLALSSFHCNYKLPHRRLKTQKEKLCNDPTTNQWKRRRNVPFVWIVFADHQNFHAPHAAERECMTSVVTAY